MLLFLTGYQSWAAHTNHAFLAYLGKHLTPSDTLCISNVAMNFKLPKTHALSFLGDFIDITKDFKSQFLENYSTNFIWNIVPVLFKKKITFHDYDWVRALLDIFLLKLLYALLFDEHKSQLNILTF